MPAYPSRRVEPIDSPRRTIPQKRHRHHRFARDRVPDHHPATIDDFKVFQLRLLVVQLLELSFDFGLLLFSLLDVGEDFLILGIHEKTPFF